MRNSNPDRITEIAGEEMASIPRVESVRLDRRSWLGIALLSSVYLGLAALAGFVVCDIVNMTLRACTSAARHIQVGLGDTPAPPPSDVLHAALTYAPGGIAGLLVAVTVASMLIGKEIRKSREAQFSDMYGADVRAAMRRTASRISERRGPNADRSPYVRYGSR